MVTDEELNLAFHRTNLTANKRDIIKYGLLKIASGYENGMTVNVILKRLNLITCNHNLNKKGRKYLYAAFTLTN